MSLKLSFCDMSLELVAVTLSVQLRVLLCRPLPPDCVLETKISNSSEPLLICRTIILLRRCEGSWSRELFYRCIYMSHCNDF